MKALKSTPQMRMSCLGIVGILLTLASASQVGAEVKARQAESEGATQSAPQIESDSAQKLSNLRCWQDGTLLFEETNLNGQGLAKAPKVLIFDREGKSGEGEVFLIETGSSTCLYKKA